MRTGIPSLDSHEEWVNEPSLILLSGEEKSGKTSLVLQIAAIASREGILVYWLDCASRLSPYRLRQVVERWKADPRRILVASPNSFKEQEKRVLWLADRMDRNKLVVVDDYTYLHRVEMSGNVSRDKPLFHSLAFQTAILKEAVNVRRGTAILVSQVHEVPTGEGVKPVAEALIKPFVDVHLSLRPITADVRALNVEGTGRSYRIKLSEGGFEGLDY